MWPRVATVSARDKVSSNKDAPPRSEQNCFGTAKPSFVVVRLLRRLPWPAAKINAQVLPPACTERLRSSGVDIKFASLMAAIPFSVTSKEGLLQLRVGRAAPES